MNIPPQVNTVFEMLENAGYEAFLVGGAVRDYVRSGAEGKDWDITTNALPGEVEKVFEGFRLIETGLKHGTVTVIIDHEPLEITTYRIDGDYSDHRHPDKVSFTGSLDEDLLRRDFTMNAMAYNPKTGIADPTGGRDDIAANRVRCVGDPDRRFREDGLRMLRALRFASTFDMDIEENTAAAIHRNRNLLGDIAPERIRVELTKMLCGSGIGRILREFADVVAVPLPEVEEMFGFEQHNPHHDRDVWLHTVAVTENISPEPEMRWAALLHDIGKPACFSVADDGVGHFYGHAEKSTLMSEDILTRLRFDNVGKERIIRLVRYHDMPITSERKLIKRLLYKHGEAAARQLIELHRADTTGQAPICGERLVIFDEALEVMEDILNEESCFSLKDLAVNGNDMLAMGIRGKAIGRALQMCMDAVLDETVTNNRQELLDMVKNKFPAE